MFRNKKNAVIVPAYNEEKFIGRVIETMPRFVDNIIIINDCSEDKTKDIILKFMSSRNDIVLINHAKNEGLGKSLIDGYLKSLELGMDITAVMAGDAQMDPDDLPVLLDKIIEEDYDYVKGNRLLHQNISAMPRYRFFGNAVLTLLTKFATGYYFMMDPQCGYTAIKNSALRKIPVEKITRGYGYNADILCMLNIQRFMVTDAQVRPVYHREKSKIKLWKYIPKTSWLLTRLFFRRLWQRYIVLDFHPLILFYAFAFFNTIFIIVPFMIRFFFMYLRFNELPKTTLSILIFTFLITFQSVLFAIWMDMDYNRVE